MTGCTVHVQDIKCCTSICRCCTTYLMYVCIVMYGWCICLFDDDHLDRYPGLSSVCCLLPQRRETSRYCGRCTPTVLLSSTALCIVLLTVPTVEVSIYLIREIHILNK